MRSTFGDAAQPSWGTAPEMLPRRSSPQPRANATHIDIENTPVLMFETTLDAGSHSTDRYAPHTSASVTVTNKHRVTSESSELTRDRDAIPPRTNGNLRSCSSCCMQTRPSCKSQLLRMVTVMHAAAFRAVPLQHYHGQPHRMHTFPPTCRFKRELDGPAAHGRGLDVRHAIFVLCASTGNYKLINTVSS